MLSDRRSLVAAIFFLSGFAALTYQVVWQRVLTQEIGVDTLSVAFIVTIFMIGLGFGSLAGGKLASRPRANLVRAYALIELVIGVFGIASVSAVRMINRLAAEWGIESILGDFLVNCSILVLPIFLMGMTSPLIMELMKDSLARWGRVVGVFYGLNVLGAAVGAIVTGLALIELLGLKGTSWVAAGINIAIGVVFLVINRDAAPAARAASFHTPAGAHPGGGGLGFTVAAGCVLLGFVTLSVQMIFFRVLANYFTLSAMVFPIMLAAFLLLMAGGQAFAGWVMDRLAPARHPLFLSALISGAAVLTILMFNIPPGSLTEPGALVFSPSVETMVRDTGATIGDPNLWVALAFSIVFMSPVFFLSGLFPAVVKMATQSIQEAGHTFGRVLFWFTLGNVIGTYVTAIFMFERFGTIITVMICFGALAAGLMLVTLRSQEAAVKRGAAWIGSLASLGLVVFFIPRDYYKGFGAGDYKITEVVEGHTGVLSVVPTNRFYTLLDMFRTESASAIRDLPGEGAAYELWRWNMSELLALNPEFRPRKVLIIGIGHGYLARALVDYDFVDEIVIVELSPEVLAAVEKHSHPEVRSIFNHPKVKFVVEDGRRYVHKALARGEKFDLIQNRINEPWRSGASSLFTVEFFADLKGLLNSGGYLATRQMIGYAVNGLQVFDHAFWPGYYHIYFTDRAPRMDQPLRISPQLAPLYLARNPDDVVGSLPPDRQVMKVVGLTRDDVAGYQLNTDDRPTLEYQFIERKLKRHKNPRLFLEAIPMPARTTELAVVLDSSAGAAVTRQAEP